MDYSYPLLCASERHPHDVALVGREESVTFEQLEARISRVAGGLASLGMAGRPVGVLFTNQPEAVEVLMALSRAGAVAVPLNPRLSVVELAFIAGDCGLEAMIAGDDLVDLAAAVRSGLTVISVSARGGGDHTLVGLRHSELTLIGSPGSDGEDAPATITYTSGTTGRPKGVVRTHRANTWNLVNSVLGSPRSRGDVELFNLPVFGIGMLHFLLPALIGGASVVLDESFDAKRAWELLERHLVTHTFLAPTMIASMLAVEGHERRRLDSLRTIYTAYAFSPRARKQAFDRFGDVFVYMYGLTEAQLTCGTPVAFMADQSNVGGTMGVSRVAVIGPDGRTLSAGHVGQIAFSGPSIMSGYHQLPAETAEAMDGEWVLTGDLGRRSDEGDLHYEGRSKEIIKTGGFSVDPIEVENVLSAGPWVLEAAVVGTPDDHWGEAVVAFIVSDGSDIDSARLREWSRSKVSGFKTPKSIHVVSEIPLNATGKVDRGRLRTMASEQHARRSSSELYAESREDKS